VDVIHYVKIHAIQRVIAYALVDVLVLVRPFVVVLVVMLAQVIV